MSKQLENYRNEEERFKTTRTNRADMQSVVHEIKVHLNDMRRQLMNGKTSADKIPELVTQINGVLNIHEQAKKHNDSHTRNKDIAENDVARRNENYISEKKQQSALDFNNAVSSEYAFLNVYNKTFGYNTTANDIHEQISPDQARKTVALARLAETVFNHTKPERKDVPQVKRKQSRAPAA